MRLRRPALAAVFAALACAGAAAHDSWLEPGPRPGELRFVTGSHYPVAESSPAASSLAASACVDGSGARLPLRPDSASGAQTLALRTRAAPALACWAELTAHDIELPPALVETYFREIQPPQPVRAAWAAQREGGLPWQERYRKSARIELTSGGETAAQLRALRQPQGLALEAVIVGDQPVRAGQPVNFQLLADGRPVPQLALQLVSARSPLGLWRRTDEQGRVQHTVPFAGTWALRGTLLERDGPDRWQSRFVTLVFEAR